MKNANNRGVSIVEGHSINVTDNGDIVVRKSFVADAKDQKDHFWRTNKMSDFLNEVVKSAHEIRGEKVTEFPIEITEATVEPFDNDESLYPQVFIRFCAIISGGKELN